MTPEEPLTQPGPGQDTELVEDGWSEPPWWLGMLLILVAFGVLVVIAVRTG